MKSLAIALIIGSTLVATAGTAQAQQGGTLTQIALSSCPTLAAGSCVPAVQRAIDSMPRGSARNAQLLNMVAALADRARRPFTPRVICLDIASGIRLAGEAITAQADRSAVNELADSLCLGGFQTAAIGDNTPPASLTSSGDGTVFTPSTPTATPPSDSDPEPEEDCEDEDKGDWGHHSDRDKGDRDRDNHRDNDRDNHRDNDRNDRHDNDRDNHRNNDRDNHQNNDRDRNNDRDNHQNNNRDNNNRNNNNRR